MSANLMRGAVPPEAVASLIENHQADVVALQELPEDNGWVEYRNVIGWDSFHRLGQGLGIAARRTMDVWSARARHRPLVVADLDPDHWIDLQMPVRVINVHLTHPFVFPWWRSAASRQSQLTAIEAAVEQGPELCIVLGDFNTPSGWPTYRRLNRLMVDAAADVTHPRRRPEPTWSLRSGGRRLLRIDHAWIMGLAAKDVAVAPLFGSDHCALLVHVEVP